MFIQKKSKWSISCRIKKNALDQTEEWFQLSFTTYDFQNFVPPDGNVTDFNLHAELGFNYPKLNAGIYTSSLEHCLVSEDTRGMYLYGISDDWQKLKDLIAKILSSASMKPKIPHRKNMPQHQITMAWTRAVQQSSKR